MKLGTIVSYYEPKDQSRFTMAAKSSERLCIKKDIPADKYLMKMLTTTHVYNFFFIKGQS